MWRIYLPESCKHPLKTGSICTDCVEKAIDNVFTTIINEVAKFDAGIIAEGENETLEQQLINKYAEGTVQGYKDAVKQILEFLRDLKSANTP